MGKGKKRVRKERRGGGHDRNDMKGRENKRRRRGRRTEGK